MNGRAVNILVLLATSRVSGPGKQILQVFDEIDRSRYRLVLACPWVRDGREWPDFFREVERRGHSLNVLYQNRRYDPGLVGQAWRLVEEEGIDIVQTHGYKPSMIGMGLRLRASLPWIAFMHGETRENWRIRLYNALDFKVVRFADRIVTVSEEMRERYIRRGLPADRITAIHNAVDYAAFEHQSSPAELRRRFGIPEENRVLGVIGRFSPEKGHTVFLQAFRELAQRHTDLTALLVGEGQEEPKLRAFCREHGLEERVVFTGYQERIADFYPAIDLVVLPSLSEGLPNVALEALCHARPVVATAVGGTPEVVVENYTGLLVPPSDAPALADAVDRLLENRHLAEYLAANGPVLIGEKFSPAVKIARLSELYRQLSDTPRNGRRLSYG